MQIKVYADFYIKNEEMEVYDPTRIETNSEIENLIQKIQLVLMTKPGDILGNPRLGCDLEKYIWNTNISSIRLHNIIEEQLAEYVPELNQYPYSLDVYFERGDIRDIGIIDIQVSDLGIQFVI